MAGKYRIDRVGDGDNKCIQTVLPTEIHKDVTAYARKEFVSVSHIYRKWIMEGYAKAKWAKK